MTDLISNSIFNRISNVGDINQLELGSIYSKILLRTEIKSLGRVNTHKRYKRYKKSH